MQSYLSIYGFSTNEKDKALSRLKQRKSIRSFKIQPNLEFLVKRLKATCDLNKCAEELKKELETTFTGLNECLETSEYLQLINQLVTIQQNAKENSYQRVTEFLGKKVKVITPDKEFISELFISSQVQQQKYLGVPLTIQIKNLYDILEGENGHTQKIASQDSIQSIRQLARFGGFETESDTSQEDAYSFFNYIADTIQMPRFPFSSHSFKTEEGRSFSVGLQQKITETDLQTIISVTDQHLLLATEETAPLFLPIQLKRYDSMGQKNSTSVTAPFVLTIQTTEKLKKKVDYCLTAVVTHEAKNIHSGHYVTFVPKILNNGAIWFVFNDSEIGAYRQSLDSLPLPALQNGYLFFYQKK
jgi:uncharacterized UBP type Zn finger protein